VVQLNGMKEVIPHACLTFPEALEIAFQKISQNEVISSWMDSWEIGGNNPNIEDYAQVPQKGCLIDERRVLIQDSEEATIERIWKIGGNTGYYSMTWAWTLRGLLDKLIGGVGLNRGRRHPSVILVGDSIDFWRVIHADKVAGNLVLFAEMKVPGEAWLQFQLEKGYLVQIATFRPKGLLGRIYWYSLSPFHFFIFRKMAKALAGEKQ
jgi:hypothetical protein